MMKALDNRLFHRSLQSTQFYMASLILNTSLTSTSVGFSVNGSRNLKKIIARQK